MMKNAKKVPHNTVFLHERRRTLFGLRARLDPTRKIFYLP